VKSARGSIGWSEAGEADSGEGSTAPSILSPLLELLLLLASELLSSKSRLERSG
jgi:hypothetical protein